MKNDGWTAVTKDKSLSAQFEHTVGVTSTGCEIFTLAQGLAQAAIRVIEFRSILIATGEAMRSWLSMTSGFAVVVLVLGVGLPSAAHAERWWGSSDVCLDLDSVHIFSGNDGGRYVSYRQKLCAGSGILLWAVAAKDCDRLRANDTSVDLYVYKEDDGKWVNMIDYFNYPIDLEEQYDNAGVACNWAFPKFP